MSVAEEIKELCRRYSGRRAVTELYVRPSPEVPFELGSELTYQALYDRTLRLIGFMDSLGLGPGERLAALMDNSADMVAGEWACLLGSYLWVGLNTRSSPLELETILASARPAVVLVGDRYRSMAEGLELPEGATVVMGDKELEGLLSGAVPREGRAPGPNDPVRIRYTSGTAGQPKGAVLARRCYDASLKAVSAVVAPIEEGDVLLQVAPMTHASGAMLLPHALAGVPMVTMDRFEVGAFIDVVEHFQVTAVFLVPTMLVRLLEAGADLARLSSLRTVVYGGASMPVDRLRTGLERLGPVFVQIYGLTESTWPVASLAREEHLCGDSSDKEWTARLASCGRPTAVGELRIVDPGGCEVARGDTGEILVRGRNTMLGYWGGPGVITAGDDEKGLDEQGWVHTGDLGFIDAGGYLTIVDRLHDMIVSGGFNIYPGEVEECLSEHPAVLESAVVGRPDKEWGERVHACVVFKPGLAARAEELIDHVASRLAAYKKPRSVEVMERLPRNPSGKVLRRELRRGLARR